MSTILHLLAILAVGYFIGSIPTAFIVMRLFRGRDLRHLGTGNVTSTAVFVHAGRLPGAVSLVGEILKAGLCIFIAYLLVDHLWAYLVIIVAAAVGQIWSVWLNWSGGQGQTILVTGLLVLCPVPFMLAIVCFACSFLITKRFVFSNQVFHLVAPLTLLLALVFNPLPFGLDYHSWGYSMVGLAFSLLFFLKHRTASDDIVQSQAWGTYSR